ncbi:hypothetical protein [Micromonospora sp. LOL_024]|uniref:hypothetical protein n=1 Tax=Micromonospora sp. LOL_024 TaxID=3345412 RepID=UPI003A87D4A2
MPLDVDLLMRAFAVLMASVSVLGLAAATRLLTSGVIRAGAAIAIVVVGSVVALGGRLLLLPAALVVAAAAWQHQHPPTSTSPAAAGVGTAGPRRPHQARASADTPELAAHRTPARR